MGVNAIKYGILWCKRGVNLLRLGGTYALSVWSGQVHFARLKPWAVSIEPANFCNLKCEQCPTGRHWAQKEAKLLDIENFKKWIDALLPELCYLNLYFQGEPFLNPLLPQMIAYARSKHIYVSVSTNGHFLSTECIKQLKVSKPNQLIISLDGYNQQSYQAYRAGGDFNLVCNGIRLAAEAGLKPVVQCLLLSSTENHRNEMRLLCKQLKVKRLVFKTAQFYTPSTLIPQQASNSRYGKEGLVVRKKLHNRCWRMWSSMVVGIDGSVYPCCYDKHAAYPLGNLCKQSPADIWQGAKANAFRKQVFAQRQQVAICCNCTE